MKITQLIGSNNKALNIEENGINTLQSYDTKYVLLNDRLKEAKKSLKQKKKK